MPGACAHMLCLAGRALSRRGATRQGAASLAAGRPGDGSGAAVAAAPSLRRLPLRFHGRLPQLQVRAACGCAVFTSPAQLASPRTAECSITRRSAWAVPSAAAPTACSGALCRKAFVPADHINLRALQLRLPLPAVVVAGAVGRRGPRESVTACNSKPCRMCHRPHAACTCSTEGLGAQARARVLGGGILHGQAGAADAPGLLIRVRAWVVAPSPLMRITRLPAMPAQARSG